MQARDLSIDVLRAMAMLCVILAHCAPPGWLNQLRNFDVPLLVLLSGMAFSNRYANGIENTKKFIIDRVLKLVVPVWAFFIFYFISYYFLTHITELKTISFEDFIGTFTFYWGIGYVWIIRIFLLICLITPWILNLNKNLLPKIYWLLMIGAYIGYEILVYLVRSSFIAENISYFLTDVVLINIPYICLFALGVKIKTLSGKNILALTGLFSFVFLLMAGWFYTINHQFVSTQDFKYPPQIYYISYALAASFCLMMICNVVRFSSKIGDFMQWISKNSLWIYLWHIMGLLTFDVFVSNIVGANWVIVYIYVLIFSMAMVWAQSSYVLALEKTPNGYRKTILKRILS